MQSKDLLKRISTGSPQDLQTRTCTRSCKDTWRISPGALQELPTMKIFMPGPLKEARKIAIKGPVAAGADLTRSWDKNLPKASHKSSQTSTCETWHLQDLHARTSWRGSHQDLRKIF